MIVLHLNYFMVSCNIEQEESVPVGRVATLPVGKGCYIASGGGLLHCRWGRVATSSSGYSKAADDDFCPVTLTIYSVHLKLRYFRYWNMWSPYRQ